MYIEEHAKAARWKTWRSRFGILLSHIPEQFFLRVCEYWSLQFCVNHEVFEVECDGHFRVNEPILSFTFEGHLVDVSDCLEADCYSDAKYMHSEPFTCDIHIEGSGPNSINREHRHDCVWGMRRRSSDGKWQQDVDKICLTSEQLLNQMPYMALRALTNPVSFCYADFRSHQSDVLDDMSCKDDCPTFHTQWEVVGNDSKKPVVVRITSFAITGANGGNDPLLVHRVVELTCTRGAHGKMHIVDKVLK